MARTAEGARNAMLVALAARCANGYLRIRAGIHPERVEIPASGACLVELRLGEPAFLAPVAGVLVATPITGARAVMSGLATWFQVIEPDGTSVVFDGTVGPYDMARAEVELLDGQAPADLLLDVPEVRGGTMIFVTGMQYRAPA